MRIQFMRDDAGACVTRIERLDGIVVEMRAYDRKYRVPHDLAHAVTERELGLAGGVFGSVVAGAVFDSVRVVSGRPRYDAAARSARILRANAQTIGIAELLAAAVHHAVEKGPGVPPFAAARNAWSARSAEPFPWTPADLAHATEALRKAADEWSELSWSRTLDLAWPRRLVPAVPRPVKARKVATVRRR